MKHEFVLSYKVMFVQTCIICKVINIIDLDLKLLSLLKAIFHLEVLDELWVEVVVDNFCPP